MSTDPIDHGQERSVVLWHLQVCMATFYTQALPKDNKNNKRKPYKSIQFTDIVHCAHQNLNTFTIAAPIRYFTHLTTIQLEHNQLTHLPRDIWRLPGLSKLNLGHNALRALPPDLGHLIGLTELYLHNNQLASIPTQIGRLKALQVLDLTHNPDLTSLPGELGPAPLRRLWIGENPFLQPNLHDSSPGPRPSIIPSLFHLCAQIAGPSLTTTIDSPPLLPLSLLSSLVATMNSFITAEEEEEEDLFPLGFFSSGIAPICSICHSVLYFPGIPLLDPAGQLTNQVLPLLYHVCSQSCRTRWLKSS